MKASEPSSDPQPPRLPAGVIAAAAAAPATSTSSTSISAGSATRPSPASASSDVHRPSLLRRNESPPQPLQAVAPASGTGDRRSIQKRELETARTHTDIDETTTEESDAASIATESATEDEDVQRGAGLTPHGGKGTTEGEQQPGRSPEEIEIERLRQAVHAKMLLNQQRVRSSPKASPHGSTPLVNARRASPIKEEPVGDSAMSPSLHAAFSSPAPTGTETASTESTESARTIRGSVPPTPGGTVPLRTPSYPFPYVPGTPRTWSSSFHQPFTALSPTVSGMDFRPGLSPREQIASGESTPAASIGTFVPGRAHSTIEDEQYPTPNLYDTVLLLNAEPGLDAWWSTVVSIVNRWFGVERATLAVPADASDLENVPWGQKCTFSATGQPHNRTTSFDQQPREPSTTPGHHVFGKAQVPEAGSESTEAPSGKTKRRPNLEARHSFAGYERRNRDAASVGSNKHTGNVSERPRGPLRTASHAPSVSPRAEHPLRSVPPTNTGSSRLTTPQYESTFSDPDFSSIGDLPEGPIASVFPMLRALNSETDSLLDSSGVNRILERGKLVTLTRDYTASPASSNTAAGRKKERPAQKLNHPHQPLVSSSPGTHRHSAKGKIGSHGGSRAADEHNPFKLTTHYEEYEQLPTSPWSQSPAPSPAIQADAAENPFFTSVNVDEDSFNPTGSTDDYSRMDSVEAIGVDVASTVTHIPLIHPMISQLMQPVENDTNPHTERKVSFAGSEQSIGASVSSERALYERRAPIAILSILSPTVPYPQTWIKSLKLLGPHLATSFSNAQQFSTALKQAANLRQGRYQAGNQQGFGPLTAEPSSLQDLMRLDFDSIAMSAPGSMTSPSDYSSRSRHSPGGSVGGTPGWDASSFGFPTKHSVGSTPAHLSGSDKIDSYFDAKKKSSKSSSGTNAAYSQHGQRAGKSSPTAADRHVKKSAPHPLNDQDTPTPVAESGKGSLKTVISNRDEAQPSSTALRETSPSRAASVSSSRRPPPRHPMGEGSRRPHSLLHSYGADFSSSFQSLPAATTPGPQTPGVYPHARNPSLSDYSDMPPPSERLLRTIIDSLPVQIFTASPGTGALTWVNSKFLVYRGQESRQVLQEPWQAIHPDDRNEYISTWQRSLRTGQQLQQKVRLLRFDGNYRWFYVRAAPLKDKRQNIVHWIGTNMDFHDQHLAELNSARQQETAASEAKYRALANSSPQIVFAVTNSKGLIFCNSQWTSYSGQTEAEAFGLGFMDFVHPEDIAKCRLPTFDDNGTAANVPTTVRSDSASKPRTKRTGSSSSSENSSETERLVTSPADDESVSTIKTQSRLSKLAGQGILKVTKDSDGRPSYSTEVRLRSKDGKYRWHLVRVLLAEPIVKEMNDGDTWYGTCTDINDHKLLEQTLKETMDAKSRFLSNMSHEIRTPLNGITGMVNFLIDSNLTSEQLEHVNIIRHSTEGLRNLIDDILDLSKVEAGMITLAPSWFHLRSLIEEVNDLMSAMAINKGLELNHVVDDEVPSMLKGDRFRIRQILLNVVGNAIKFTTQGEVFVRCRYAEPKTAGPCQENETVLQFDVTDTGSGFTEKEAEFLFKRFSQIDGSTTRQQGGTGLGLAISMQLAELHGGRMRATSVPGSGSTFTFTIKFEVSLEAQGLKRNSESFKSLHRIPEQSIPSPTGKRLPTETQRKSFSTFSSPGQENISQSPASLQTSGTSYTSPALSTGSSAGSLYTTQTSIRSIGSSFSSHSAEASTSIPSTMVLNEPPHDRSSRTAAYSHHIPDASSASGAASAAGATSILLPPLYSILVVCPLEYSRLATVKHIEATLPKTVPHQITARASIQECQDMLGGDDPVIFTHVVLVLREINENIAFMNQIIGSKTRTTTAVIIITDLAQKREIINKAPHFEYERLVKERRLLFVFKPLKPSKFAAFFDPQKEREMSRDPNHNSAQQVAVSQKAVFEDLKRRLGNKGNRVLLVEDNQINQTVSAP